MRLPLSPFLVPVLVMNFDKVGADDVTSAMKEFLDMKPRNHWLVARVLHQFIILLYVFSTEWDVLTTGIRQ